MTGGSAEELLRTSEPATFRTKKQMVVEWLREQIVSGQLESGTRITQADLAGRLGLSMTPVREALQQLVAEGYLVRTPHVGVSVAASSRDRIEEVFPVRLMLEGFLAARAAERVTDEDLATLHQLSWSLERAVERGDVAAQRTLNFRFHQRIWDAAQHPIAVELVNQLWAKFPADLLYYLPDRGDKTVVEHAELMKALSTHDPDAAREAMQTHIASGLGDHRDFRNSAAGAEPGDGVDAT